MQASNQISFQRSTRWALHHNSFHGNLTPTKVPQKVFPPTMKNIFFPFIGLLPFAPVQNMISCHILRLFVSLFVWMEYVAFFVDSSCWPALGVVKVIGLSSMSGCFLSRGKWVSSQSSRKLGPHEYWMMDPLASCLFLPAASKQFLPDTCWVSWLELFL